MSKILNVTNYYVYDDYSLYKSTQLITNNVRSINYFGYINNITYYSYDGDVVIFNAKLLSYYYILTFNGNIFDKNGTCVYSNIIKITANNYALNNEKQIIQLKDGEIGPYVDDIYYSHGTFVIIGNKSYYFDSIRDGYFDKLRKSLAYDYDPINILSPIINYNINPLYENIFKKVARLIAHYLKYMGLRLPRPIHLIIFNQSYK